MPAALAWAVECHKPAAFIGMLEGRNFGKALALLWHILSGMGFPNHFFCDSWVVGFWRGRPWRVGPWIGEQSLDSFSSHFWIGWVTKRGEKCVRSTCRD